VSGTCQVNQQGSLLMDGFSAFVGGAILAAGVLGMAMIVGVSVASVKDEAVKRGWMEYAGKHYSVQPANLKLERP
jgi:hypothetical protein